MARPAPDWLGWPNRLRLFLRPPAVRRPSDRILHDLRQVVHDMIRGAR
jgi:hypothetical protein